MGCICSNQNELEKQTEVLYSNPQEAFMTNVMEGEQVKTNSLRSDKPCLDSNSQEKQKPIEHLPQYRPELQPQHQPQQLQQFQQQDIDEEKDNSPKEEPHNNQIVEEPKIELEQQEPTQAQDQGQCQLQDQAQAQTQMQNQNQVEAPKQMLKQASLRLQQKQSLKKKDVINELKQEDFDQELLKLINKMRKNPRKYADYIEDSMPHIELSKGKLIYNDRIKVKLEKGNEAFNEASEALRVIPSMSPLTLKKDLCIKPPETKEQLDDKNYLPHQIEIIQKRMNIKSYWNYQVSLPEVALLLMIVSDTKSASKQKRNDLLSPKYKFIGISHAQIGKVFNSYLTFTDQV